MKNVSNYFIPLVNFVLIDLEQFFDVFEDKVLKALRKDGGTPNYLYVYSVLQLYRNSNKGIMF